MPFGIIQMATCLFKFSSQYIFLSFVYQVFWGVSKKMEDTVTVCGGYILRQIHTSNESGPCINFSTCLQAELGNLLLINRIWQPWWYIIPLTRLLVSQMWWDFADVGRVDVVFITSEIILDGPDIIRWKPLQGRLCPFVRLFLNGFEEVSYHVMRVDPVTIPVRKSCVKELWTAPHSQSWPRVDSTKALISVLQLLGTEFC